MSEETQDIHTFTIGFDDQPEKKRRWRCGCSVRGCKRYNEVRELEKMQPL